MKTGTVKWFNEPKGFGFITPDEGGADVFATHREIKTPGVTTLREGQHVKFDVKRGLKGYEAIDIQVEG